MAPHGPAVATTVGSPPRSVPVPAVRPGRRCRGRNVPAAAGAAAAETARHDHRPCGAWRLRTRRRRSGAAPTGHRSCPTPRTCPARPRPAPGTAPDSRPAAARHAAGATSWPPTRTPTHPRPSAAARNTAAAGPRSPAARPGWCGAPPRPASGSRRRGIHRSSPHRYDKTRPTLVDTALAAPARGLPHRPGAGHRPRGRPRQLRAANQLRRAGSVDRLALYRPHCPGRVWSDGSVGGVEGRR